MPKTLGNITFTPELLTTTFQTYREQLIVQPMLAMSKLARYCSIRTGIRYRETVSEMSGKFQMGNYKKDKLGSGNVNIHGRVLETFFGNCIEPIDPNAIYQTIWGSNVTKGEGLKNVPIVLAVCSYILNQIGENLYLNAWTAKHEGTKFDATTDYFNGLKTILDMDIAGTNETGEVLISEALGNLETDTEGITAENAEDKIKNFYWNRNEKLRGQAHLEYFMSDKAYHLYTEAYQQNHGALPYNQSYDKRTLEGASHVEICPLSNVPEDFLLLTTKSNILLLYNQKTDDEKYICEKSLNNHYDIDFIANMFFGTQFESVSPEVLAVYEKKTA